MRPTRLIESDDPLVVETARSVTSGCTTDRERAIALFEFVRDEITYDFAPEIRERDDLKATRTLQRRDGACTPKAVALASLLRAVGIPAMVAFQEIRDHKLTGRYVELNGSQIIRMHGLNAVHLDGRWLKVDATLDAGLVRRKDYRLVEFDGCSDALLPVTDLAGKPHFEVTIEYGSFPDVPDFAWQIIHNWVLSVDQEAWTALVKKTDGTM